MGEIVSDVATEHAYMFHSEAKLRQDQKPWDTYRSERHISRERGFSEEAIAALRSEYERVLASPDISEFD